MSQFQQKSAGILATVLIALIIVSFLFTGWYSYTGQGSSDQLASVGDFKITINEFQRVFQRQLSFYSNLFGGKELTEKQIEQFNIKGNVLNTLVTQKTLNHYAEKFGVVPSNEEVALEIQNQSYFKSDGQFNIILYKDLLKRNGLTPTEYEKTVKESLQYEKMSNLLKKLSFSSSFESDLNKMNEQKVSLSVYKFEAQALKANLEFSSEEVRTYLSNNTEKVKKYFDERKDKITQKEEVKARHILILSNKDNEKEKKKEAEKIRKKLTTKNFKRMANKYTEDPSGKENGGDLGYFSKGRMVKEFEEMAFSLKIGKISPVVKTNYGFHIILVEDKKEILPLVFENFKNKMALELLRENSSKKLKKLQKKVQKDFYKLSLDKGLEEAVEKFSKFSPKKVTSKEVLLKELSKESLKFDNKEIPISELKKLDMNTSKAIQFNEYFVGVLKAKGTDIKSFQEKYQKELLKNFSEKVKPKFYQKI